MALKANGEPMPVYVDDPKSYPHVSGKWCHMMVGANDPLSDLHSFALAIGLRLQWFQDKDKRYPHYDLVLGKRITAIAKGAIEISSADMIKLCKRS